MLLQERCAVGISIAVQAPVINFVQTCKWICGFDGDGNVTL